MQRKTLKWQVLLGVGLLASVVAVGCGSREKSVPFSEYGETIDHLPIVRDLPGSFAIVDEVEPKECHMREEQEASNRVHLFESQGRASELSAEDLEHDHDHAH